MEKRIAFEEELSIRHTEAVEQSHETTWSGEMKGASSFTQTMPTGKVLVKILSNASQ